MNILNKEQADALRILLSITSEDEKAKQALLFARAAYENYLMFDVPTENICTIVLSELNRQYANENK